LRISDRGARRHESSRQVATAASRIASLFSKGVSPMTAKQMVSATDPAQVMHYVIELEAEVDRLRRRDRQAQNHAAAHLDAVLKRCLATDAASPAETLEAIARDCREYRDYLKIIEAITLESPRDSVEEFNLRQLAQGVVKSLERLHPAVRAVLHFDLMPELVRWFPAKMVLILDSLISNSLRYHDAQKGEIRISVEMRLADGHYQLRVTDNGLGMDHEQISHALELQHRAGPSRSAGLGVGLAVVKAIVEQCCGSVSLTSHGNHGTSVELILPRFEVDDFV
jgi:signal transduction histidine kinase